MSFPFTFFGAAPDEYESGFPPYLVTFTRTLSDAEQATAAAAITSAMRNAGVGLGDAVKWDGDTMLVVFDERVPDWDQFFEDLGGALRDLHDAHPIAQVIFLNAEPSDADPPGPATPGPRFGFACPFD